ncbi:MULTISPECIES: hypothetical protein [Acetobacter]|uniref:Uncharacterized protein n=1 Tax=Acetobacter ascendens TaxID=481146 RepID=A0A1Y0V1T5_9PROT|nr:hypothetical protein [Acetobacter ascendens]ARW11714.1 hypothetical protein S101447_02676 [Acetobacter ascendens]RCL08541.1 hypothetical protein BBA71_03365 [Acetobacter pasteurianus]GCD74895.1 hypothetical protein NBRC3299_1187 [Acetobacter pasteurianus NBRC 3299]
MGNDTTAQNGVLRSVKVQKDGSTKAKLCFTKQDQNIEFSVTVTLPPTPGASADAAFVDTANLLGLTKVAIQKLAKDQNITLPNFAE